MLTKLTQTAIAILYDIANKELSCHSKQYKVFDQSFRELISRLIDKNIIRTRAGGNREDLSSYELARPEFQITLLDIVEATQERLEYCHILMNGKYENFIEQKHNQDTVIRMACAYLEEIKLTDLFKR